MLPSAVVRSALVLLVTAIACLPCVARAADRCEGEKIVVVPLEPIGLQPLEARAEEEKVRDALKGLSGVCVIDRRASAEKLRAFVGHRIPACEDVSCRRRVAAAFDADWLYSGAVYGLGGGRTITLQLWNAEGTVVQRGSFVSGAGEEPVISLLREARLGRSLVAEEPVLKPKRSRWPELATGALAVTSLAVGLGFGAASQDHARMVSEGTVPCDGTGDAYVQCFAQAERNGRQQATLANVFLGAGAVLAAGATVMFVLEWP